MRYKLMKKIKLLLITFFILIFIITPFYIIVISQKCKKMEIFSYVKPLGIGFLTECYNQADTKNNIKNLIKGNKFIYNTVANIKIKLLPNYGKLRDIYQSFDFNKTYKRENFNEVKNLKGIITNDNLLKKYELKKKNNDVNYKKWDRSHGNNWNTKFFDSKK